MFQVQNLYKYISNLTVMNDLYYAFTHVEMQRVHTTLTIDDFDCIKEDIRYIFYNKGDKKVSTLPLPARERKVQRNMIVKDCSNRNLVFIPTDCSADIFVKTFSYMLEKTSKIVNEREKPTFRNIKNDIETNVIKAFIYNPEQRDIDYILDKVYSMLKLKSIESQDFMREVLIFLGLLMQYKKGNYYPLVKLLDPFESQDHALIHLSVEKVKESFRKPWQRFKTLLKFGLSGRFTFTPDIDIQPSSSNHIRVYAPAGMLIKDTEFAIGKLKLKGYLEDYFDEMRKFGGNFNILFGLSRKGFHLGILPLLSLLLWIIIISPVFFNVLRSPDFILALLGISATILVAIGIYAIEKKILRHFIITQIILVYLFFAVEILLVL